jgi:hypothetical protein
MSASRRGGGYGRRLPLGIQLIATRAPTAMVIILPHLFMQNSYTIYIIIIMTIVGTTA